MQIVEYDPKYREDFVRLNTEWLTKLYYIESYDQYSMDHVEELIGEGSMVYFALQDGKVLATMLQMRAVMPDVLSHFRQMKAGGESHTSARTRLAHAGPPRGAACSAVATRRAHGGSYRVQISMTNH